MEVCYVDTCSSDIRSTMGVPKAEESRLALAVEDDSSKARESSPCSNSWKVRMPRIACSPSLLAMQKRHQSIKVVQASSELISELVLALLALVAWWQD